MHSFYIYLCIFLVIYWDLNSVQLFAIAHDYYPASDVVQSSPPSVFPERLRHGLIYKKAKLSENNKKKSAESLVEYVAEIIKIKDSFLSNKQSSQNENEIIAISSKKKFLKKANELANSIAETSSNYTANFFDQKIDHFGSYPNQTFKQKYFIDLSHYKPLEFINNINAENLKENKKNIVKKRRTAMIEINGEQPISGSPSNSDVALAYSLGSAVFTLEHRYYGVSLPSPLTNKNMMIKTLTIENVLADLINFMEYVEKKYLLSEDSEEYEDDVIWYCVGGSYSGALSAWLRLKYPDKIVAAWSSSGVVNTKFDFYDFDASVNNVISPMCSKKIKMIYELVEQLYDASENDPKLRDLFLKRLRISSNDFYSKADIMFMLADGAAMAVQYGGKSYLCDSLLSNSMSTLSENQQNYKIDNNNANDPINQYIQVITQLWGSDFTNQCYYSTKCLSDASYANKWGADYVWVYQCCSTVAFWQTSYPEMYLTNEMNNYNDLFSFSSSLRSRMITTDYFMNQCQLAFFPEIFPNTYDFNKRYGGINITQKTTKVVATQGSDDPWQWAGVNDKNYKNSNNEYLEFTAVCEGCGHCIDLSYPSNDDSSSLKNLRLNVMKLMTQWVMNASIISKK